MPGEAEPNDPIRIGISTCLLGQKVRYDGGHKHDRYITEVLGPYFEFVPVCPELEAGMGVPRESVRLVRVVGEGQARGTGPRMIGTKSGADWTARMNLYALRRAAQLSRMGLSGYILKKDSPSCGMERVKVYDDKGMAERSGVGLFALSLMAALPLLPIEEEGRLCDARLRENFIARVFAYHRLRGLFATRWTRGHVVAFHTAQKLLLMAHSPKHYQELGRLVAAMKGLPPAELRDRYCSLFMEALRLRATPKKNANVLQHIVGYLREHVSGAERQDILDVIEDYRRELVPLVVPLTLLRHYVKKHDIAYIAGQSYLNPHPKELMLRNHV